jgi:hypothetical protein
MDQQEKAQDTFKHWINVTNDTNMYFMRTKIYDGVLSDRNWNKDMSRMIHETQTHVINANSPYARLVATKKRLKQKVQQKKHELN